MKNFEELKDTRREIHLEESKRNNSVKSFSAICRSKDCDYSLDEMDDMLNNLTL